ncbi:MAG: LuxR C-terminal-related transcriptional regulator [Acidimicrobiales bacterium]
MADRELSPLSRTGVAQRAVDRLEGTVSPRLVDALCDSSDGLPDLVDAVIEAGRSDGSLRRHAGVWGLAGEVPVPHAVVERAEALLDGLSTSGRRVAESLALCQPLPLAVLETTAVAGALDELDERGLLEIGPPPLHRSRLTSPLVAAHLRRTCPPLRGIRHRRAVLEVLDGPERHHTSTAADDARLVVLRLDAGVPLPPEEALAWAGRARALGLADTAMALAEHAGRTAELREPATLVRAEAMMQAGRNHEAETILLELGPPVDPDLRAVWVMARVVNLFYDLGRADEALALLADGIEQLPCSWRAELEAFRGTLLVFLGRPREALATVESRLGEAPDRALAQACVTAAPALLVLGRFEEAAEVAQRGARARRGLGDQPLLAEEGIHVVARAMALTSAGHLGEADALTALEAARALELGDDDARLWAGIGRGRVQLDQGYLTGAAAAFRETAALAAERGSRHHGLWAHAGLVQALAQSRSVDLPAAEAELRHLAFEPIEMMACERHRALGWAAAARGDLGEAAACFERAVDEAAEEPGLQLMALHDLVRIGDTSSVPRLVDVAEGAQGPLPSARRAHALALADEDPAALVAAATSLRALGAHLLAAEAAAQGAVAWRRVGDARSARAAGEAAAASLRRCQQPATPALAMHPGVELLSPRERQIALLAAAGLADKEIAAQLGISSRTVGNLLARAYRKLAVDRRGALKEVFEF